MLSSPSSRQMERISDSAYWIETPTPLRCGRLELTVEVYNPCFLLGTKHPASAAAIGLQMENTSYSWPSMPATKSGPCRIVSDFFIGGPRNLCGSPADR